MWVSNLMVCFTDLDHNANKVLNKAKSEQYAHRSQLREQGSMLGNSDGNGDGDDIQAGVTLFGYWSRASLGIGSPIDDQLHLI